MMVAGVFDFKQMFSYNGHDVRWACKEIVAAANCRYRLRECYNLFDTLAEIAYSQGDMLIAGVFNKYRKKLDCACNQNALFTRILVKVNKGGKCYDAGLVKAM